MLESLRWRWSFRGYLVRALVRQKKTEQAVKEARAWCENGPGDRLLLVLAHAATGDVKQAVAAAERIRDRDDWQRLYRDEDASDMPAFIRFMLRRVIKAPEFLSLDVIGELPTTTDARTGTISS